MRILLIHQGFPGQFNQLIPALQARGDVLWAISGPRAPHKIPAGVRYLPYQLRRGNGRDTLPLASELETKLIRGEAVAAVAAQLAGGAITGAPWRPDLILGHPGWGEMLFLADIWPDVPQLHYVEFFHGVPGTDNDFADRHANRQTWQEKARARVKNTHLLANLEQMAAGLTPTHFQHSLLPAWVQAKTSVIHDGIDTAYRGVHVFHEALALLQARHPTAQAVLVGRDSAKVSYGAHRRDGIGWLSALKQELGPRLDWQRIHPLGPVPHATLRNVYRVSAAHVYLSYPFVLSLSLLEAMSCGALVISHGHTGLLVNFSGAEALATSLLEALQAPARFTAMRQQARSLVVSRYPLEACLGQRLALIDRIAAGAAC